MPKRQPVDSDYVVFSQFLEDVRAEMRKIKYSTTSKDVALIKQAEQMGFTAQECATVIIRNRNKRKR
jgi:lipoate synthase